MVPEIKTPRDRTGLVRNIELLYSSWWLFGTDVLTYFIPGIRAKKYWFDHFLCWQPSRASGKSLSRKSFNL